MLKTIYISGKIAGCDHYEAFNKFTEAASSLLKEHTYHENGHTVSPMIINPMAVGEIPNGTWQDYMERDLIYLKHCDAIYMLKDWKDSAGARIEHEFAKKLGLEIIYEGEKEEESNGNG